MTHHDHYTYDLKFNRIQMSIQTSVVCDLEDQRIKMNLQSGTKYWKQPKHQDESYIAFCGDTHCCFIRTTRETVAASSATGVGSYKLTLVPTIEWLGLSNCPTDTSYVSHKINFSTSGHIPNDAFESFISKTRTAVVEMWYGGGSSVSGIMLLFDRSAIDKDILTVKVDKEVQFNSWVFKQIKAELRHQGFIVEEDKINKQIVPNVCEFRPVNLIVLFITPALYLPTTRLWVLR